MPSIDIPLSPRRKQYTANVGQTEFVYDFVLFNAEDMTVIIDGEIKELTTDYTITGVGNELGGNVVINDALSGGELVTLFSEIGARRDSQYQQDGLLDANPLERDFDTVTLILQEHRRDLDRSVRIAPEVQDLTVTLPNPVSGRSLKWDGVEGALKNSDSDVDEVVATATAQAGIATTQAGIATTQAGIATTQAGNANTARIAAEQARDESQAAVGGVKVTVDDTTAGFLNTKLLVGTGLTKTTGSPGGDERLTIAPDIASEAEAQAGTATDKLMTPQRTRQHADAYAVPVGTIEMHLRSTPPTGRLELDGATGLSRTTYAALYDHLVAEGLIVDEGSKEDWEFGDGDGSTTFSLGDYRDMFPRGWDGVRDLGSQQLDQMQRITGFFEPVNGLMGRSSGTADIQGAFLGSLSVDTADSDPGNRQTYNLDFDSANSPDARVSSTTDGETRPVNIALMFTIKY